MYRLQKIFAAALSLVLIVAVSLASTSALQRTAHTDAQVVGTPVSIGEIVVEDERDRVSKEDILWLARGIYSETKRSHEQELVAWVIRNRFETQYRGRETYREVVLDPYQFSAFNPRTRTRPFYTNLAWNSQENGFQTALSIAAKVATAKGIDRPFAQTTRHFYSRRSMRGGRAPGWARNARLVSVDSSIEPDRFRFFDRVS